MWCPRFLVVDRAASRRPARFAPLAAVVALAAGVEVAACAPAASPVIRAHSLTLPLAGPCPVDATAAAQGEFSSEVNAFAATVTGPGIDTPIVADDGAAPMLVQAVPVGVDRIVALFGLSNGFTTWRGVSGPVEVSAGKDTPVDVLLVRVTDLSCPRSTTQSKRVFHTATLLDDGLVLVVGGAADVVDASAVCGGCKRATATTSAALYDPRTGSFSPVGGLTTPRMFHTAARLADGRVVIAGGTREALLRPVDAARFPFPIEPTFPEATVELYDPAARAFVPGGDDPGGARVFAAATTLPDGDVIITGGIPAASTSRHDLGNALGTSTVCGGAGFSCRAGPPLARRRAGHSAFSIAGDGVHLWGGSVDLDPIDGVAGYHLERLDDGAAAFQLVDVATMQETRNLFFAATAQYFDVRVLSAGGLLRDRATGAFTLARVDGGGGPVYVFDRTAGESGGIANGRIPDSDNPAMALATPSFFASAAGLPDRRSAVVAGGFTNLAFEPSSTFARFDEAALAIGPLQASGAERTLRQPRGGATATGVGDGTVLFVGGVDDTGASLETAEVFADRSIPPQAADLPTATQE
jgi:hypothetical protein